MSARIALLAALLSLAALTARADEAGDFKKAWARAQDADARQAALRRLGEAQSVEAARLLARAALDAQLEWPSREVAVEALCAISAPAVVLWAGEAVAGKEKDPLVRAVLCDYLGARATSDPQVAPLLLRALDDEHTGVLAAAIRGLARTRTQVTVDALVRLLGRPTLTGRARGDCLRALRGLTGEAFGAPEEWRAWWAAAREGWTPPSGDAPPRPSGDEPGAHRTVTRLAAPADAGRTIYGGIESRAVLFVVDFSYSMHVKVLSGDGTNPTRLDYVKEALVDAIENQLTDDHTFNIVGFSSEVRPWKRKLVKANAAGKRDAVRWVRALRPEGETNIHDTLELAFQHPDVDTIYFLTDGMPNRGKTTITDEILGAVRGWNAGRNVRVCAIAFLAGDAAAFNVVESKDMQVTWLRALAAQNGGTFTLFE
ncbi:MAG: VWA domain-containing protein [Planctomycetes bacterium]|nr:VWA domain-containing protein [Planctomycetota bacterium]